MADDLSPLGSEIRRLIAATGPMTVAEYMRRCLTDPKHGYYMTRDPLGARGDFTTAPEISQMFGELIGLWLASVWRQMGSPDNVRLIELGPGRATMMLDVLRAVKVVEGFSTAIMLHFVEISPTLQEVQQRRLEPLGVPMLWHKTIEEVPGGPCLILANEFIDALPVHQAIRRGNAWYERVIELSDDDTLHFGMAYDALPHFEAALPRELRQSPEGSVFEWRSDRVALEVGRRVREQGAALILDYGHTDVALGESLQAVVGHAYTDPLAAPGEADLTAHVDFEAIAQIAESIGALIHGPIQQRDLLIELGIEQRAAMLKANASPEKAAEIDLALSRLTAAGTTGMGELFKALAIASPALGALPGFEKSR